MQALLHPAELPGFSSTGGGRGCARWVASAPEDGTRVGLSQAGHRAAESQLHRQPEQPGRAETECTQSVLERL